MDILCLLLDKIKVMIWHLLIIYWLSLAPSCEHDCLQLRCSQSVSRFLALSSITMYDVFTLDVFWESLNVRFDVQCVHDGTPQYSQLGYIYKSLNVKASAVSSLVLFWMTSQTFLMMASWWHLRLSFKGLKNLPTHAVAGITCLRIGILIFDRHIGQISNTLFDLLATQRNAVPLLYLTTVLR